MVEDKVGGNNEDLMSESLVDNDDLLVEDGEILMRDTVVTVDNILSLLTIEEESVGEGSLEEVEQVFTIADGTIATQGLAIAPESTCKEVEAKGDEGMKKVVNGAKGDTKVSMLPKTENT